MLSEQTRKGEGRENVKSVLLGRGASDDKVDHWLREAAPRRRASSASPSAARSGGTRSRPSSTRALEREAAAEQIADKYLRFIQVYDEAAKSVSAVSRRDLRLPRRAVAAGDRPTRSPPPATASATAGATARLKTLGTMYSGPRSASGITAAIARAAASFIASSIAARADVQRAAEDAREGEHVVDLVRVVAAAGGHDRDVVPDRLGLDLGRRVGHREHDRVRGHRRAPPRRMNAPGAETPTTTSAPSSASLARAAQPARVRARGHRARARPSRSVRSGCRMPPMSQTTRSRTPCSRMIFAQARPAAPAPTTTTRTSSALLADDLQRVEQRRQHDDRGAVLVVVEDRDVERLLQPPLDLEAARRGDVLEVDAAERGRDALDDADDLVDVVGVQAQREGVDAGELLEQHRLALHHRHRGLGADVAQARAPRVPSETTATVLPLIVSAQADSGSSWMALLTRARRRACRPSRGRRGS